MKAIFYSAFRSFRRAQLFTFQTIENIKVSLPLSIAFVAILLTFHFKSNAIPCHFLVGDTSSSSSSQRIRDYQLARILAKKGEFLLAQEINQKLREKISNMKIVSVDDTQKMGSHGAYIGILEDGTRVLIKPYHDNFYASISKEVGASVLSDLTGLSLVPVAGYRVDPKSKLLSSVHLIHDLSTLNSITNFFMKAKNLFQRISLKKNYYQVDRWSSSYGSDVAFFLNLVGYSHYEAQPRHIFTESAQGVTFKSVIDLGSAFIDDFDYIKIEHGQLISIPIEKAEYILAIDEGILIEALSPYWPEVVIQQVIIRLKYSAEVVLEYHRLKLLPPQIRGKEMADAQKALHSKYGETNASVIQQKWEWKGALNPPTIVFDKFLNPE